jgi:DNA-binding CsgD family transcriptional regulator
VQPSREVRGDGTGDRSLTHRQAEIIQLLVSGMTIKQIARYLGISTRTVDRHLSAARERAGARTKEELIGWTVWTGSAVPGLVTTQVSATHGQKASALCARGRPPMMTPERVALAQEYLPDLPVAEVARKIGVSRSTLYGWLRANVCRAKTHL